MPARKSMTKTSVFRLPQFRRLFAAQTISRGGDVFNTVALLLLAYSLTGSGRSVAITVAFEIVPVLLFGPVAGAAVDRLGRRRIMVAADIARAAVALALVIGPHNRAAVYAAAFGLAAGTVFFNPASSALLPALVDRERLVGANSALWTAAVLAQIVLAPVAGALFGAAGARTAFAVNAVSYVVSALLLTGLPDVSALDRRARWRSTLTGGLHLLRHDRLVSLLVAVQLLAALSAGATSALLVVLAERRLGVGPSGFGVLLAAIGVGAAIGPAILWRLPGDKRTAGYVFAPYALRGGVDAVLALTTSSAIAAGALALYGIGTSTGMVTFQSLLQSRLPDNMRGRAFALFDVTWQGGRLMSLLIGGLAAERFGIRSIYAAGALLMVGASAIGFALRRRTLG